MRAAGGPDVLELTELPEPSPAEGELVVAVEAAGVNFRDVYEREAGAAPPAVAGVEGAGTVVEVGPDVDGFAPGDRVAWKNAPGSYAEHAVVPVTEAVPVPAGVGAETAAAALLQGLTAHYLATAVHP